MGRKWMEKQIWSEREILNWELFGEYHYLVHKTANLIVLEKEMDLLLENSIFQT